MDVFERSVKIELSVPPAVLTRSTRLGLQMFGGCWRSVTLTRRVLTGTYLSLHVSPVQKPTESSEGEKERERERESVRECERERERERDRERERKLALNGTPVAEHDQTAVL